MGARSLAQISRNHIVSINPATGNVLREYEQDSDTALESKLRLAAERFSEYRKTPFAERSKMMHRAAEILEGGKETFGRMMTEEMGKTIVAAVQEAEKCALGCRYYAENAEKFLADEEVKTNATRSFVRYQPLGPVLAVMPWNFPFWQVFRFAAPGLMAGNVGLLKHASNVPQCALAIEEIFRKAGFPEGVFQTLLIGSDRVDNVIADSRVAAVTLTGSVGAGSSVGAAAGKAIKKSVLELGGSDPFIVMPSADLDRAVQTAVQARVINNGQSCIAAKRFIVHQAIAEQFREKFVERMASLRAGDPLDRNTELGPLATSDGLRTLEEQVSKTLEMGARAALGGKRMDRPGHYFEPTVLCDIPKGSPAFDDELFGPVACLFEVKNMADAIHVANDSRFGLGACAWTNDAAERETFINEIESGVVFLNGMVASDPRMPFGGVKHSGYGRELSYHGIREFVNTKAVSINDLASRSQ
jgi:succinate-semialdehyde dehydrogenase / glutarate-semialdehyde dehydrogenase